MKVNWVIGIVPTVMMGDRLSSSPTNSTSAAPDIPVELAKQQEPLYKFLLNKWYFDELYDLIFVRSRAVDRARPLEVRRRLCHRRAWTGRHPPPGCSMSRVAWSGCRLGISTTTLSRC